MVSDCFLTFFSVYVIILIIGSTISSLLLSWICINLIVDMVKGWDEGGSRVQEVRVFHIWVNYLSIVGENP